MPNGGIRENCLWLESTSSYEFLGIDMPEEVNIAIPSFVKHKSKYISNWPSLASDLRYLCGHSVAFFILDTFCDLKLHS